MLGEIISKPFTFLLVGCLIVTTAFCSIMVTRLAGNYQERARCMQLANALVSYGQKNNGFSESIIYKNNKGASDKKNINAIINNTINVFGFSDNVKPTVKIYKGIPTDKDIAPYNILYPTTALSSTRLNRGDSFTVEITPKYNKITTGKIEDGKPIKAIGKAHGYIKVKS